MSVENVGSYRGMIGDDVPSLRRQEWTGQDAVPTDHPGPDVVCFAEFPAGQANACHLFLPRSVRRSGNRDPPSTVLAAPEPMRAEDCRGHGAGGNDVRSLRDHGKEYRANQADENAPAYPKDGNSGGPGPQSAELIPQQEGRRDGDSSDRPSGTQVSQNVPPVIASIGNSTGKQDQDRESD